MATEANIEAARKLIASYRAITLEDIERTRKHVKRIDESEFVNALHALTGFGVIGTCPLCKHTGYYEIDCKHCIHFEDYYPNFSCKCGDAKPTFSAILKASTPEELLAAARARADYLEARIAKVITASQVGVSYLLGMTMKSVEGKVGWDVISFCSEDGRKFELYHDQDCCEDVTVEDICGDLEDLVGSPILQAEEVNNGDDPPGWKSKCYESWTWTFYKFATIKGSVTIRWLGVSNGYYSESVSFGEVK